MVFILLSSVPLLILGFFSYNKSSTALETKIQSFSSEITVQAAHSIRSSMKSIEAGVNEFQNNKNWMETLNQFDQGIIPVEELNEEVYAVLGSKFSAFTIEGCVGYSLIYNDQFILCNFGNQSAHFAGTEKQLSDIASQAKGKPVWMSMKGKNSDENYLLLLMQIFNQSSGEPIAAINVVFDETYLHNVLKDINIDGSSDILIIDSAGKVISAKDTDRWAVNSIYTNKSVVDKLSSKIMELNASVTDKKTDNPIIKGAFEALINNDSNLICFSQITGTDWSVIGTIPMSYIKHDSNQIMNTILTVSIAIFILAILISVFISASISRPLNRLGGLMKEASEGNLNINVKDRYRDEISVLGSDFDSMVQKIRSLVSKVSESSNNVLKRAEEVSNLSSAFSSTTEQVTESMNQIAMGTAEQAEDNAKTLEFVNILSEDINNVENEVSAASEVIHSTRSLSEKAIKAVKSLNENTVKTSKATNDIVNNINQLNNDMKEIQKIVKFIGNISEQTNLLSLNAAIEAARAGEAGKGFAVVAGEVRKLADQTKESLSSISNIIKSIEEKSKLTVLSATNTQGIISQQVEAVNETDNSFKAILEALANIENFTGRFEASVNKILKSGQLTLEAINNISSVSQETAATVEEVTAASQQQMAGIQEVANDARQLNELARELYNSISIFKV